MSDPALPPRVALTSSVAPARDSSGRKRILNAPLPGARIAYSVYASCVKSRSSGGVGRSEPSGLVPPGNGLSPRPRCAASQTGIAARRTTAIVAGRTGLFSMRRVYAVSLFHPQRPLAGFVRAGGIRSSRAVRFRPPHVRGRTARDVGWRCIGRMEPRGAAR